MDKKVFHNRTSMYVVTYVAMFAMTACSILYSTISQRNTEHKFCAIITTVNDAYRGQPEPATELGRRIKNQYIQLEADLHCRRSVSGK